MRELKVAVIGLGMGRSHIEAYSQIEGVRVEAVCDVDVTKLKDCAEKYGIKKATSDYREAMRDPAVDIVSVCTPDHLHYEHCKMALECGKHVMCEKPMVTRLDHARELVALVKREGVKFAVGNVSRFVSQFQAVKKFADDGRLATLFHVEADYVHDMRRVYRRTPWRIDSTNPQDSWIGGGVHPMDLVRWVAGDVSEIMLYSNKAESDPEFPLRDNHISILKFKSGCLGKVWEVSAIRRRPEHVINFNAYGSRGTIMANTNDMWVQYYIVDDVPGQNDFTTVPLVSTVGHPVRAELQHFIDCIREDGTPMTDAVDGAKTVATLVAGLRSFEEGKPMRVEEVE